MKAIDSIREEIASQNGPWVSIREACRYLDVSRSTLNRWISGGKLSCHKVDGVIRIHHRDLDSLIVFGKPYRKLLKKQRDRIRELG